MKLTTLSCLALLLTANLTLAPVNGQQGDKKGEKMTEVWRDMDVPEAPVLSPQEALKSFKIAPGFRIELVAAEPLVEDPVAITWDEKGRLWVVEMRGYMPNVDGKGEDARVGTIRVLTDTDGDGKMDKAKTFLDKLQMPRAMAIVEGGILVAEPPKLWYCPDADGDLKADKKIEVFSGYGKQGPVEHTDNGLLHGIDNWMYNAKSSKKLHFSLVNGVPVMKQKETFFSGQWGITKDDDGRLFYNNNSKYLSGNYFHSDAIDKGRKAKVSGINAKIAMDNAVYSIRVNPGINRGYKSGMLRDDGRLAKCTATCGPVIYRGDQFPQAYAGDAFIPEPAGNVVTHWDMIEKNGKIEAVHKTYSDTQWKQRDFMASTDERFRPVAAKNGPDGALYIVDMYRGILQHRVYVTTFLRKQILERGLDKPIGFGRIYRIVHEDSGKPKSQDLSQKASKQLVSALGSKNGWVRDTAQRLLIEKHDSSILEDLKSLTTRTNNELAAIHALWTIEGMGLLTADNVLAVLNTNSQRLKIHALRAAERVLISPSVLSSPSGQKLENVILTLSQKPESDVGRQALLAATYIPSEKLIAHASSMGKSKNKDVKSIAQIAMQDRGLEMLKDHLKGKKVSTKTVQSLAKKESARRNAKTAERMTELFDLAAKQSTKVQAAILKGIYQTKTAPGQPARPMTFHTLPKGFLALAQSKNGSVKKEAAKLKGFIIRQSDVKKPRALTSSEKALFDEGQKLYNMTCVACHLPSGLGEAGKAPSLVDSPYVLGKADIPVRIVLNGLQGPITVHDQTFNLIMPGLSAFNDRQIAGVVTYIRRHWEHGADPVTEKDVAAIRKKYKRRVTPWTAEELK